MVQKVTRWAAALLALVFFGLLANAGCRIQLCKGDGCGGAPDVGGWGGSGASEARGGAWGGAGGSDAASWTAADWESFAATHQEELAYRTVVGNYAAATTAALVEAQVGDPSTIDDATLEALIAEYAPQGVQAAEDWAAATDLTELIKGVIISTTCQDSPWDCPFNVDCPNLNGGDGARCYISGCGKGECPYCPSWFSNLVFKHYCVYGCVRTNGEAIIVGGAFLIRTIFKNWNGPWCIK